MWQGNAAGLWMCGGCLESCPVACTRGLGQAPTTTRLCSCGDCFLTCPAQAGAHPVTKPVTGWHLHMATCRSMAQPPRCGLGLSLLPAPAANGDGHDGHPAASGAHCHAAVVHGVGPQGAGALGVGTAARQRPAVVTGHRHLGGEGRHPPRVTKGGPSACPRWSPGLV